MKLMSEPTFKTEVKITKAEKCCTLVEVEHRDMQSLMYLLQKSMVWILIGTINRELLILKVSS